MINHLGALALLALTTRAASTNGTDCKQSSTLESFNATGTTSFAGVRYDGVTGKISNDTSANWTFGATVMQKQAGFVSQGSFLDTSATVGINDTSLPYNGCLIVLSGSLQSGDECLSPGCIAALEQQFRDQALRIARNELGSRGSDETVDGVCGTMNSVQAPDACKDSTTASQDDSASWGSVVSFGM